MPRWLRDRRNEVGFCVYPIYNPHSQWGSLELTSQLWLVPDLSCSDLNENFGDFKKSQKITGFHQIKKFSPGCTLDSAKII